MVLYALYCVEGSKGASISGAEGEEGNVPECTESSLLLGAIGAMLVLVI